MSAIESRAVSGGTLLGAEARRLSRFIAARPKRVTILVTFMLLMGITDLILTLTYMQSSGMIESNPIARAIALGGAPGATQLVVFKLCTMSLSAILLFVGRRHWQIEAATWAGTAILVALMFHWTAYNTQVEEMANEMARLAQADERPQHWVVLD